MLTIKMDKQGNFLKAKARWVLRVFQDKQKEYQQTDVPASTRPRFRMSCQMTASKNWDLFHIDLETAFLQGQSCDVNRDVACQLPPEAGHPPYIAARLKKPACVMNNASRRWWNILDKPLCTVLARLGKDFHVGSENWNDVTFTGQRIRWTKDPQSVYTHSLVARTFSLRDVQTSRTRVAQVSEKGVCSVHVAYLHLAFSVLMIHPPSLLFPHGYFDTTFQSAPSSSSSPRPKSARVKRTSARASRSSATWLIPRTPQVMSPNSPTRPLLWTVTRRPSTTRTTITLVTSRNPHARTLDSSVFPQCVRPLFRTFLMVILLFRKKAKKEGLGKPLQDREKERKEKVL